MITHLLGTRGWKILAWLPRDVLNTKGTNHD